MQVTGIREQPVDRCPWQTPWVAVVGRPASAHINDLRVCLAEQTAYDRAAWDVLERIARLHPAYERGAIASTARRLWRAKTPAGWAASPLPDAKDLADSAEVALLIDVPEAAALPGSVLLAVAHSHYAGRLIGDDLRALLTPPDAVERVAAAAALTKRSPGTARC